MALNARHIFLASVSFSALFAFSSQSMAQAALAASPIAERPTVDTNGQNNPPATLPAAVPAAAMPTAMVTVPTGAPVPVAVPVPFNNAPTPTAVPSTPAVTVIMPNAGGAPPAPPPQSMSSFGLPYDYALASGLANANRGDWNAVRQDIANDPNQAHKDLFLWLLVTRGTPTFFERDQALRTLPNYPERRMIRIQAEQAAETAGLTPAQMIEFMMRVDAGTGTPRNQRGPITGEGKMELGLGLVAIGRTDEARGWISDGWRNHRLSPAIQTRYLGRVGGYLTADDHDARVDFLLWADRRTQARSLFPLMSEAGRTNAQYRIDIAGGRTTTLSGSAIDDRAITFERVRSLRRAERDVEAIDLLLTIDPANLPETANEALWTERRILANEALGLRRYMDAYRLSSTHGYQSGERFADGEFMSGWIALRFLNQPDVAARHFQNLQENVSSGMSLSRGYYWRGRAAEALNNPAEAQSFYTQAGRFPTFFYGQLAIERLASLSGQAAILQLPEERHANAADQARLIARPEMVMLRQILDSGDTGLFSRLALGLDDGLNDEGLHQALSEWARGAGLQQASVRIAKAGLNRQIIATEAAFPMVQIPRLIGYGQAEDAFTLAIARQETEFNTAARSSANALGLMQFVPATAAAQARRVGLEHHTEWLIARPEHSLLLGSTHLYDLVQNLGGSYIMTAAAYNAGPSRPISWVSIYGDPRGKSVEEAIDWIEMIPFSETRNYVMRVMENIQVYRARLAGGSAPLSIGADITRGTPRATFQVNVVNGASTDNGTSNGTDNGNGGGDMPAQNDNPPDPAGGQK